MLDLSVYGKASEKISRVWLKIAFPRYTNWMSLIKSQSAHRNISTFGCVKSILKDSRICSIIICRKLLFCLADSFKKRRF